MDPEAPPRTAVDGQVQDSGRDEHAPKLSHHRSDVLHVVDAVLDDREIVVSALAGQCLTPPLAILNVRVAEPGEHGITAIEGLQRIYGDALPGGKKRDNSQRSPAHLNDPRLPLQQP